MAAEVLGTPDPGRGRFPPPRRIHALQPGETRARHRFERVAVVDFSRPRQAGVGRTRDLGIINRENNNYELQARGVIKQYIKAFHQGVKKVFWAHLIEDKTI